MRVMHNNTREAVYEAPVIPWNNGTYTPISNKSIMDLMEDKLRELDLKIKGEEFRTATTAQGLVRGVIAEYYITSTNEEFGQQIMFRNSYDKSMSFAFCHGLVTWICSNGCLSGDYTYKRTHLGTFDEGNVSSTWYDIVENITTGFKTLQESYETITCQMNELKKIEVSPNDAYDVLGELFFGKEVLNITQLAIVKRELKKSVNFRHLGDVDFTAFDLYQNITESLKTSAPIDYLRNHTETHALFEQTFGV